MECINVVLDTPNSQIKTNQVKSGMFFQQKKACQATWIYPYLIMVCDLNNCNQDSNPD